MPSFCATCRSWLPLHLSPGRYRQLVADCRLPDRDPCVVMDHQRRGDEASLCRRLNPLCHRRDPAACHLAGRPWQHVPPRLAVATGREATPCQGSTTQRRRRERDDALRRRCGNEHQRLILLCPVRTVVAGFFSYREISVYGRKDVLHEWACHPTERGRWTKDGGSRKGDACTAEVIA